jgi:hypothetical protein
VRFCPWYPLQEAGWRTPPAANVLQVRVATGLMPYPRGRSAMVFYAHAGDARRRATALAERWAGRDLWCRHLIEIDAPQTAALAEYCEKLAAEFVRRFGAPPAYTEPDEAG